MCDMPKRRKDKYNTYKLKKINGRYIIEFRNFEKNKISVEISDGIFDIFNNFELIDLAIMNEFDRHIEHIEFNENTLNKRFFYKEENVEDIVINNIQINKLHKAINSLPDKQKYRIKKYFFDDMTQQEIATEEKCSIRAIQYSLKYALKNLKKFLDETSYYCK